MERTQSRRPPYLQFFVIPSPPPQYNYKNTIDILYIIKIKCKLNIRKSIRKLQRQFDILIYLLIITKQIVTLVFIIIKHILSGIRDAVYISLSNLFAPKIHPIFSYYCGAHLKYYDYTIKYIFNKFIQKKIHI